MKKLEQEVDQHALRYDEGRLYPPRNMSLNQVKNRLDEDREDFVVYLASDNSTLQLFENQRELVINTSTLQELGWSLRPHSLRDLQLSVYSIADLPEIVRTSMKKDLPSNFVRFRDEVYLRRLASDSENYRLAMVFPEEDEHVAELYPRRQLHQWQKGAAIRDDPQVPALWTDGLVDALRPNLTRIQVLLGPVEDDG